MICNAALLSRTFIIASWSVAAILAVANPQRIHAIRNISHCTRSKVYVLLRSDCNRSKKLKSTLARAKLPRLANEASHPTR